MSDGLSGFFQAAVSSISRVQFTIERVCKRSRKTKPGNLSKIITVESRFLEPSVFRTSRYLEPNLVSLGFASLKLYNFTPDFSNPRFLETPDNSNQFWLPWDKLTLDNSNLRKFPHHLVRMSIAFTPLNKLALPDKLFSRILITQQASHKSVISLKGEMTASDCQHSWNWAMQSACLLHSAFC